MEEECFWGLTLDKDNKKVTWDPEDYNCEGSNPDRGEQMLIVRQILLGQSAIKSQGELNIIEVDTMGYKSDIKVPIAILKSGVQNSAFIDLLFPGRPVTFRLTEGNGPVHIQGKSFCWKRID
uniref:Nucleoplasmin core domain-containing protein n=1 Tax=Clastoptera arizonana TaxID=38151 RepID=A0A1B6D2K0_9HEMI